jgi:hypothetical protein
MLLQARHGCIAGAETEIRHDRARRILSSRSIPFWQRMISED